MVRDLETKLCKHTELLNELVDANRLCNGRLRTLRRRLRLRQTLRSVLTLIWPAQGVQLYLLRPPSPPPLPPLVSRMKR